MALVNRGLRLAALQRTDEELAALSEVEKRFGEASDTPLRQQTAKALLSTAFRLGVLQRFEEELAVFQEVIRRYGADNDPQLGQQAAIAMLGRAGRLGASGRFEEELALYDEVDRRRVFCGLGCMKPEWRVQRRGLSGWSGRLQLPNCISRKRL